MLPITQCHPITLWTTDAVKSIDLHPVHHRHCYYSAQKLMFIVPSHGGWKAEST